MSPRCRHSRHRGAQAERPLRRARDQRSPVDPSVHCGLSAVLRGYFGHVSSIVLTGVVSDNTMAFTPLSRLEPALVLSVRSRVLNIARASAVNSLNAAARHTTTTLTRLTSTVRPDRFRPLCALASGRLFSSVRAWWPRPPPHTLPTPGRPDRRTPRPTPAPAPTRCRCSTPTCRTSASSGCRPPRTTRAGTLLHDQHDHAPEPGCADHEVVRPRQLGDRQLRLRPGEHRRLLLARNGQNSYGQGQWALSLRYHDGTFYVAFNTNNLSGAYLYRTDDIENGAWQRTALGRGLHDPSLFFDVAARRTSSTAPAHQRRTPQRRPDRHQAATRHFTANTTPGSRSSAACSRARSSTTSTAGTTPSSSPGRPGRAARWSCSRRRTCSGGTPPPAG